MELSKAEGGREDDGDVSSSGQPIRSSTLAEDLLAAPSGLPTNDPVRVETTACLRRCVRDVTTPPA